MDQLVAVSFIAVAFPNWASVLVPVEPRGSSVSVSDVIAMFKSATELFLNVMMVPIGYATEAFAAMVNVLILLSATGWKIHFPASASTVV